MTQDWGTTAQVRRKSFGFFSRPSTVLQDINDPAGNLTPRTLQKSSTSIASFQTPRSRPKSLMFSNVEGGFTQEMATTVSIPSPKPRRLSKGARPKSMFGNLKTSKDGSYSSESSGSSSANSTHEKETPTTEDGGEASSSILYHGEAMTAGGLLRRKKEYLVLTPRELLRYKSQHKAWEKLGISEVTPKTPTLGVGRSPSFGSASDIASSDNLVTQLHSIVAVYRPEVDLNSTIIQVDFIDDLGCPSSAVFQMPSVDDAQIWLDTLRNATALVRDKYGMAPISANTLAHIARKMEIEDDYVPDHFFRVYSVVQRGTNVKSHHRSSSDDLQKLYSTICYIALGVHKVHIISIPKSPTNRSASNLSLSGSSACYGLLNLSSISMSTMDDSFIIGFRFVDPVRSGVAWADRNHKISM